MYTKILLPALSISLLLAYAPHTYSMSKREQRQQKRIYFLLNNGVDAYFNIYGDQCCKDDVQTALLIEVKNHEYNLIKRNCAVISADTIRKRQDRAHAMTIYARPSAKHKNLMADLAQYIPGIPEEITEKTLQALRNLDAQLAQKDAGLRKQLYKKIVLKKDASAQAQQDLSQSVMLTEAADKLAKSTQSNQLSFFTRLSDYVRGTHHNIAKEIKQGSLDFTSEAQKERVNTAIEYLAKRSMLEDLQNLYETLHILEYKYVSPDINTTALAAFKNKKQETRYALARTIAEESIKLQSTAMQAVPTQLATLNMNIIKHLQTIQKLNEAEKLVHECGITEITGHDDTYDSHEEDAIYASIGMQKDIASLSNIAQQLMNAHNTLHNFIGE